MSAYSLDLFRDLFRYTAWADATVWRAVLAHDGAKADGMLVGYARHIHAVQRAFLLAWRGESPEAAWRHALAIADADELWRWAQPYYAEVGTYLESLDAAALDRPMVLPWVAPYEAKLGRTFAMTTLGDTMFQAVSHSTYHRGQVNARLRAVGGEPPLVDHIAWTWFGKPDQALAS